MRIIAELVLAEDLKPGELYSSLGPAYWDFVDSKNPGVGERAYIRTNTPCPADQVNEHIYRLTIVQEQEEKP